MKIGFVIDDTLDKPDGVQQYVLIVGGWLAAQGHEVHYLAGASKRQDIGNLHSLAKNVRVTFNGNRLTIPLPANGRRIRQLLEQEQYDILHIQMPYSPMLAHKIIRLAPKQTAIFGTFHILPQTALVRVATHALGFWTASSLKRFDKIFAVSPAAKTFVEAAFRVKHVEVLPNVVDMERFRQAQPLKRLTDGPATIMFLGRLVPRKGCAHFLDALAVLKQQHPELGFKAVVCGKGELETQLKHQATQLGLAKQTEFAGFLSEEDKPRYVASADVIAFPSTGGESFGIVLTEAMSTARPVVLAGDNPGYRSVMHEQPELLFRPQDHQLLADKIYAFLSDKAKAKQMVAWQAQHVRQFDIEVVGPKLVKAYRQHLRNKAAA